MFIRKLATLSLALSTMLMTAMTADATTIHIAPTVSTGGTISPLYKDVVTGSAAIFTLKPSYGYEPSVTGTCGGALVGTKYTTAAITSECSVSATFAPLPLVVTIGTKPMVDTKPLSYVRKSGVLSFLVAGATTQQELQSTVTTSDNWIVSEVLTYNGKGKGTLKYTVAANESNTGRTGTITIAGKTYTIYQAAKPAKLTLTPSSQLPLASSGGSVDLTVAIDPLDAQWSLISTKFAPPSASTDWLKGLPEHPVTGGTTLSLEAEENRSDLPRSAVLTFQSSDSKSKKTFTVKQNKRTPVKFSQADLQGEWQYLHFLTGPNVVVGAVSGWVTATLTADEAGNMGIGSLRFSSGETGTDVGTLKWTVASDGSIKETGTAGFSRGRLKMSTNKQLIVGVASEGDERLLRVAIKRGATYSDADITGPFDVAIAELNSGSDTTWGFMKGFVDANKTLNITEALDPNGGMPVNTFAMQISSSGEVSIPDVPNWHGYMTPDKKLIFGINTWDADAHAYSMTVVGVLPEDFAVKQIEGKYTEFALANSQYNNSPIWDYGTGTFSWQGSVKETSSLDSNGSTVKDTETFALTFDSTGMFVTSDTHGFVSHDRRLLVNTSTWEPGVYALGLVLLQ